MALDGIHEFRAKNAIMMLMAITIDFIREVNFDFQILLPLNHFFCSESVDLLMNHAIPSTKHVGFFTFDSHVPRLYTLSNGVTIRSLSEGEISYKMIKG